MAELEFNTTISHIQRGRDVYKVHDAARNRKKQKKGENEKEFMDMLNESEKDVDDFTPRANTDGRANLPTNHMLNQLGTSSPPPMIEIKTEKDKDKS